MDEFRVTQLYALLSLWYSTNGDNWVDNEGWLIDESGLINENECTWYGIGCTKLNLGGAVGVQDVVTQILMFSESTLEDDAEDNDYNNNLVGSIPADIGLLENIKLFYFYKQPELAGTLPNSLKALTKLEEFTVAGCNLSGSLPEGIGFWKDLKEFWMYVRNSVCHSKMSISLD